MSAWPNPFPKETPWYEREPQRVLGGRALPRFRLPALPGIGAESSRSKPRRFLAGGGLEAACPPPADHLKTRWYPSLVALIVCFGYMAWGRGFAGLHVPGTPLYVGEALLGATLLVFGSEYLGTLARKGMRPIQAWISLLLGALLLLALVNALRHPEHELLMTLRDSATVYYLLFIPLLTLPSGRHVAMHILAALRRYSLLISLLLLTHVLFQDFLQSAFPVMDESRGLFASADNLIGVFAVVVLCVSLADFARTRSRMSLLSMLPCLTAILLAGSRGVTLGGVCGFAVWCTLSTRRLWLISTLYALVLLLLFLLPAGLFVADLSDAHISSADRVAAKFEALVSKDGGRYKTGTGAFRLRWWRNVADHTLATPRTAAAGFGFGCHLGQLTGDFPRDDVRGAHNAWINILGWCGLAGLFCYLGIFVILSIYFLRAYLLAKRRGQENLATVAALALTWITAASVTATFDNTFSNPTAAIPLYVFCGACIATIEYIPKEKAKE